MSATSYLQGILAREAVDTSQNSPVRGVIAILQPHISQWAGSMLRSVSASGSFAKGTANKNGTDIDLFISISNNCNESLGAIYASLLKKLQGLNLNPRQQNVSLNVKVAGFDVDLVPAKHQGNAGEDHSLYRRRANTWTQTNVAKHIAKVSGSGRTQEIRVLKLWRNQKGLDFPSFYLELTVINALSGKTGTLDQNVWTVLQYLRDNFANARVVDPANTNNVISDDLTVAERAKIVAATTTALKAKDWNEIVK